MFSYNLFTNTNQYLLDKTQHIFSMTTSKGGIDATLCSPLLRTKYMYDLF